MSSSTTGTDATGTASPLVLLSGKKLERRLEELLHQDHFAPPTHLAGTPEIEAQIRDHVAEQIGKLARPKRILWTEEQPKTNSGKIMRRLLRDIAEGRALGDVTTLRDPAVMAELAQKVSAAQAQED
jgi:acyl-CoA synthetase (AMP-forming)/AMP-acid ligase II